MAISVTKLNQPVATLFAQRWTRSLYLSGVSLVLAILVTVPLGIFQAVRRNGLADHMATGAELVIYATRSPCRSSALRVVRAKGLPERLVLSRHLVRNACLPMITLLGLSVPALLAGHFFVETVFNYLRLALPLR